MARENEMAGELVPLVLIPRYTTLAGAMTFTTIAMDVTEYEYAHINFWRGPLIGGDTPTITITFEESMDQENWSNCAGVTNPVNPSAGYNDQESPQLKKRWFRFGVTFTGTDPVCTCWAVGFLEERTS